MTTPNLSTSSAINSPLIGQPMNSSYETQWLGSASNANEDRLRRRSSQGGSNSENARERSRSSAKRPATKAERRALQEKQRLEKQKRVSATATSSTTNAPNALEKKPLISNPSKPKVSAATKSDYQQKKSILNYLELSKKPDTDKNKDLHPAVLSLALLFSQYKIVGSNARCVAVLETLSQVIKDHCPPVNATFVRHIQKHLDPHIAFLLKFRYMSLSIRECIRWLKKVMADLVAIHPPVVDQDAQQMLLDEIARFIRERITMADEIIAQYALTKIEDGDVILTFAKSSVIEHVFLEAKKSGKDFQVIIIDSRPLLEGIYKCLYILTDYNCLQLLNLGKNLCIKLVKNGINCKYTLISGIYIALKTVTKVFMGSHAILNNGSSYARIGSAAIAMAASDKQIPVILCCETYKFVNGTQVDSLVMNEKGDPNSLVYTGDTTTSVLADWKQQPNLSILNLMYDVTPSKYISLVITEIGIIPCTSAPVVSPNLFEIYFFFFYVLNVFDFRFGENIIKIR